MVKDDFSLALILDWTSFMVYPKTLKIVARVSQRVFVGFPLCIFNPTRNLKVGRNEEYIKFSSDHAVTVGRVSRQLTLWPKVFRPYDIPLSNNMNFRFVAYWYLGRSRGEARGYSFLAPVVEERKRMKEQYQLSKDTEEKPVSKIPTRS
jgi:hypothetical protein